MSDEVENSKKTGVRRQRSIYQVHYNLQRRDTDMAKPLVLLSNLDIQAFDLQVAGHQQTENTKYFGLLQCSNGTILKPILKATQQREVEFYNHINSSTDPCLVQLRDFVPKYFGCTNYMYNGYEQQYIILEDLTQRMLEQCVMDVKIGKRTWDPLATEEKIKSEQSKYALCKQEFGFCIPGYQVHELATGHVRKRGKDHGKKLHGHMVRDAIKTYLNGFGQPMCRALILQFLSELWKIQKWARSQACVRLYCTSLLLVYDAAKLRDCCGGDDVLKSRAKCRAPPSRRRSVPNSGGGHLSGQLSDRGPVYKKLSSVPLTCMTTASQAFAPPPPVNSPWTEALDKLNYSHSFDHNYEENLSKIKINYRSLLDQLSSDIPNSNPWGTVKIIDFAHAFFNNEDEMATDDNFREGIDNFVAIFENLLKETDDSVA